MMASLTRNSSASGIVATALTQLSPACRPSQLGVVVTNCGYSDWSTMDFPDAMQV